MPASVKLGKDLSELLACFRSEGVEFLVVGGHAVALHGYPRLTEDLDLPPQPRSQLLGHRHHQRGPAHALELAAECLGVSAALEAADLDPVPGGVGADLGGEAF